LRTAGQSSGIPQKPCRHLRSVLRRDWRDFNRNKSAFLFDEFRKTCNFFDSVAEKLEERKRRRSSVKSTGSEEPFNMEIARTMILEGRVPPAHWLPSITSLEFGTRRLRDLPPLVGLTSSQAQSCSGTSQRSDSPRRVGEPARARYLGHEGSRFGSTRRSCEPDIY
jgi:hypothetical protein